MGMNLLSAVCRATGHKIFYLPPLSYVAEHSVSWQHCSIGSYVWVDLIFAACIMANDEKKIFLYIRLITFSYEKENLSICLSPLSRVSFKLVSIRNNRNWNRNWFRHYPKQNICFGCFASIPKQRVLVFQLNRNKQLDREHILVFFSENVRMFRFVLVCFETVCFGCFASVPKQRVSMFRLNRNKQKTSWNNLIQHIFCYFSQR